jgi:hypothetical protein
MKRLRDMTALEMAAELSPKELRGLARTGGAPLARPEETTGLRGGHERGAAGPADEQALHVTESRAAEAERDAEIKREEQR